MKDRYDVIVAGSGPAGFASAYYAATNGADVLLVEKNGELGGMLTTGMMGVFCGTASCGIFGRMQEDICVPDPRRGFARRAYDVEEMKQFLYAVAEECGMSLLLHTVATGTERTGRGIDGLKVHARQGPLTLKADVYIDATGDGDVAAFAGEEFTLGRESDGKFQPVTLVFGLGGVDTGDAAILDGEKEELLAKLQEYVERGEVPYPAGHIIVNGLARPGFVKVNMTNAIDIDGTRSEELTRAEVLCRKQLAGTVKFLRENARGFENCYVSGSASMIGVRETRHIHGDYQLNELEISQGKVFDDWAVSRANYCWGTHNLYGPIHGDGQAKSKESKYGRLPHDKPYTIPYRSLLPAGSDNLLLAGRCISGTFLAHSNYRVMPICMAMGQAAGSAAAMCVKKSCALRELDVHELQDVLTRNGVEPPG